MNGLISTTELERIEQFIAQENCTSMTSSKYRKDLLFFLANNADKGQYVCEVGPYKGGLTAQLAYACKALHKKLIICEAIQEYADIVKRNLHSLGYADIAQIHVMPFTDFISQNKLKENTILTIIDANHIYPYALQNFQAIRSVKNKSYAVAFHDFGLRDTDNIMGVERAVRETFFENSIYHIGDNTAFNPCELHTAPAEDKTFFRGSEGALIITSSRNDFYLHVAPMTPLQGAKWHTKQALKELLGIHTIKRSRLLPNSTIPGSVTLTEGTYGRFYTLLHDTGVGKAIRETGHWGDDHIRLFKSIIKKGSTIFDIGANIGHHSVCFSKMTGTSGKVFAFEPQLPIFHVLCANAMINSCTNIYPIRAVVGEQNGMISIPYMSYDKNENFGAMCIENKEQEKSNIVPKLSLDGFVNSPLNCITSVDFIKIDVQTFELFVLQGALATIEKHKPELFIEISPYWMKHINDYDYREIYHILDSLGYVTFTPSLNIEQSIPDFALDETTKDIEWDILATHKESELFNKLKQI